MDAVFCERTWRFGGIGGSRLGWWDWVGIFYIGLEVFFSFVEICHNLGEIGADFFIDFELFIHIESGQPVIDHEQCGDIIEFISGFFTRGGALFDGMTLSVAVGADGEEILIFEFGRFEEFADDIGHHLTVDGIDNADFFRFVFEFVLSERLRDADHIW